MFSDRLKKSDKESEETMSELYRQIGQFKIEMDCLKKRKRSHQIEERYD